MTRAQAIKVIAVLVVHRTAQADLRVIDVMLSELEAEIILEEGDTMGAAYDISFIEDGIDPEEILEGNLECLKDLKAGQNTLDAYDAVEFGLLLGL